MGSARAVRIDGRHPPFQRLAPQGGRGQREDAGANVAIPGKRRLHQARFPPGRAAACRVFPNSIGRVDRQACRLAGRLDRDQLTEDHEDAAEAFGLKARLNDSGTEPVIFRKEWGSIPM